MLKCDGVRHVGEVYLFTDESRFKMFMADGRQRVWSRVGEQFFDVNVVAWVAHCSSGVMVWAGIDYGKRTHVHCIDGVLNAQRNRVEINPNQPNSMWKSICPLKILSGLLFKMFSESCFPCVLHLWIMEWSSLEFQSPRNILATLFRLQINVWCVAFWNLFWYFMLSENLTLTEVLIEQIRQLWCQNEVPECGVYGLSFFTNDNSILSTQKDLANTFFFIQNRAGYVNGWI